MPPLDGMGVLALITLVFLLMFLLWWEENSK